MNYTKEKQKYITSLDCYQTLKEFNTILAGGCITSMFNGQPIADYDCYYRSADDCAGCLQQLINDCGTVLSITDKAVVVLCDGALIQLIYFQFFATAAEIFTTFDFTVCMGAYDCKDESFHFHEGFWPDNCRRILSFNTGTAFPYVSAFRVMKYKDKGYKCSRAQYMKIMLACSKVELKSFDDVMKHTGGMYGDNYSNLISNREELKKDFTVEKFLDCLEDTAIFDQAALDNETSLIKRGVISVNPEEICDIIRSCGDLSKMISYKSGEVYFSYIDGKLAVRNKILAEKGTVLPFSDITDKVEVYKMVDKNLNSAQYTPSITYRVGEVADPANPFDYNAGIYFNLEKSDKTAYGCKQVALRILGDCKYGCGKNLCASKALVLRDCTDE